MDCVEKFQELKRKIEVLEQRKNKAEGKIEQLQIQLQNDFGCVTIEEAKKKSAQLKRQAERAEKEFQEAIEACEDKYGDILTNV